MLAPESIFEVEYRTRFFTGNGGFLMALQIDESILKDTTQCKYEFACLKMEDYPLCQVTGETILGSGIYVKAPKWNPCFYKVSWESNHICLCPTRSGLWELYKK